MADIELDYVTLMQDALRRVVYDVLTITAELEDTPGEHHFYVEFLTHSPDVIIPDHLRDAYPERMTIVLHHQFYNLSVTEESFTVTLKFKGVPAELTIPFSAIIGFADPSVKFGLRFDQEDVETSAHSTPNSPDSITENASDKDAPASAQQGSLPNTPENDKQTKDDDTNDGGADVVSLDAFRKK